MDLNKQGTAKDREYSAVWRLRHVCDKQCSTSAALGLPGELFRRYFIFCSAPGAGDNLKILHGLCGRQFFRVDSFLYYTNVNLYYLITSLLLT